MDMIVLNLPKAEEVLNVKKEYEDKQLNIWNAFREGCRNRVTEYIKGHLQEWLMTCIEQMKARKQTYTTYDVGIPCSVIWETVRTFNCGYKHDNRIESYSDEGRDIAINILKDILIEFNKQSQSTGYCACVYNSSSWSSEFRPVDYIKHHDKDYDFDSYNSSSIKDVFDGKFHIRISFEVKEV